MTAEVHVGIVKSVKNMVRNEMWNGFCPFVHPPFSLEWIPLIIDQDGIELRLSVPSATTLQHYVYHIQ